jgi:hypothetical protein
LFWHSQWGIELLNAYKGSKIDSDKIMAFAVLAFFITSLIVRLTDNVLQTTDKMYPIAALVAAIQALPRIRSKLEPLSPNTQLTANHPEINSSRKILNRKNIHE